MSAGTETLAAVLDVHGCPFRVRRGVRGVWLVMDGEEGSSAPIGEFDQAAVLEIYDALRRAIAVTPETVAAVIEAWIGGLREEIARLEEAQDATPFAFDLEGRMVNEDGAVLADLEAAYARHNQLTAAWSQLTVAVAVLRHPRCSRDGEERCGLCSFIYGG